MTDKDKQATTLTATEHTEPKKTRSKRSRRGPHASEHYAALLRRLQLAGNRDSFVFPVALGVTSFGPGQGTTTVAANLAISAADSGSVLLVDANLNRPGVGKAFRAKNGLGLVNLLDGSCRLQELTPEEAAPYIVSSPVKNLSLLLAGTPSDEYAAAYDRRSICDLLEQLKHSFDLIIFDLPPATELTTCFAIASCLDGNIIVVEPRSIERKIAERSARQLSDVNVKVLGAVYNKDRGSK